MPDFAELTALFAASYELVPASAELRQAQSDCEDEISDATKEAIAADVDRAQVRKAYYLMSGEFYSDGQSLVSEPKLMGEAQSDYYLATAEKRGLKYTRYEILL